MRPLFRRLWIVVLTLCLLPVAAPSLASDGIPDNCEYTRAPHYRANIFPRYEAHNRRLVLVDWTTGAEVGVIATDLADTLILGWSGDCRYLAGAVGSAESRDTVVWDAVNGGRVGHVPDARGKPHAITWGPHNFLMVETRAGAVLWNVPANTQVTVTTAFDPFTARNFSRLRWDAENRQVIGNLAVGGREVYDLDTGARAVEIINTNTAEARFDRVNAPRGEIVIGGKAYTCQGGDQRQGGSATSDVRGVEVEYMGDIDALALVVRLTQTNGYVEAIQMIEDGLDVRWFQERGWSPGCRYFAASVGVVGTSEVSDTLVWDIIENRRVGAFTGAYLIQHPITWADTGDALLVETRDGAYLWHLPSDTRALITAEVETALTGQSGIRSFVAKGWDTANGHLLAVEIGAQDRVRAYDIRTGARVGEYVAPAPLTGFVISPDGSHLLLLPDRKTVEPGTRLVMNRGTGAISTLKWADIFSAAPAFSPDNRYFVLAGRDLVVWDLGALNADGSPTRVFAGGGGYSFNRPQFIDAQTVRFSGGNVHQMNIVTGEGAPPYAPPSPRPSQPVAGENGFSRNYFLDHSPRPRCATQRAEYDHVARRISLRNTMTLDLIGVVEENLNRVFSLHLTPNCRYLTAFIADQSNEALPYDPDPVEDNTTYQYGSVLVLWDVTTGERLYTFPDPYLTGNLHNRIWSRNYEQLFVRVSTGSYLYDLAARRGVFLRFSEIPDYYGREGFVTNLNSSGVYWDFARGRIYVKGWRVVYAFDMRTGEEVARFTSSIDCVCYFSIFQDSKHIILFGDHSLSIWRLDTLENVVVDLDPYESSGATYKAFSPDARYLVLARGMIRVWDLQNLPETLRDRDPVYNWPGPEELVRGVRFIDEATLELTTSRFVGKTYRMNIHTGEFWLVESP